MSESQEYRRLSREELEELAGEDLSDRAALSLIDANLAVPVNAPISANVLSDGSITDDDAPQDAPIDRSN
jgi:hypothetical protein